MIGALKKRWNDLSKEKRKGKVIAAIVAIAMSVAAIVIWVLSPYVPFRWLSEIPLS